MLEINSIQLQQSASSASVLAGSAQRLQRHASASLSVQFTTKPDFTPSPAARALLEYVNGSGYLKDTEKSKFVRFIATLDADDSLSADPNAMGQVWVMVSLSESANQRKEYFNNLAADQQKTAEQYSMQRALVSNEREHAYTLSVNIMLEQLSQELHGKSMLELQQSLSTQLTQNS